MQVTEIKTTDNTNKITGRKVAKTAGFMLGTTVAAPALFLVADNFSKSKKNYLNSVKKETDIFEKTVNENTEKLLNILKKMGKPINDENVNIVKRRVEDVEGQKLNEKLEPLKKIRKSHIHYGLKISAGLGLSAGAIALAIKSLYDKHEKHNI